jgi:hypothetical protein
VGSQGPIALVIVEVVKTHIGSPIGTRISEGVGRVHGGAGGNYVSVGSVSRLEQVCPIFKDVDLGFFPCVLGRAVCVLGGAPCDPSGSRCPQNCGCGYEGMASAKATWLVLVLWLRSPVVGLMDCFFELRSCVLGLRGCFFGLRSFFLGLRNSVFWLRIFFLGWVEVHGRLLYVMFIKRTAAL